MRTLGQLLGTSSRGVFEDDIDGMQPGDVRRFTRGEQAFDVTATRELGCDTGRRRYRVECVTCGELVHEATTGPRWNMEHHVCGERR